MPSLKSLVEDARELVEADPDCPPSPGCETGKHWNCREKKCMDIPEGMKAAITQAHESSKKAHVATKTAKGWDKKNPGKTSMTDHHDAGDRHQIAKLRHGQIASDAKKAGFQDLSDEHVKLAIEHGKVRDTHYKKAKVS